MDGIWKLKAGNVYCVKLGQFLKLISVYTLWLKLILIALIIQVPLTGERRTRVAENKEIAKAEDEKEEVLSHT